MNSLKSICLALLMICCVIPCSADEVKSTSETALAEAKSTDVSQIIKVYYFHGKRRCNTCNTIEAYTQEALNTGFADLMKSGGITWQTANFEADENKHFEKDFELMFSSVIVAKYKDGKQVEWKNLQKVWEVVRDKEKFTKYIQDEVQKYLKP